VLSECLLRIHLFVSLELRIRCEFGTIGHSSSLVPMQHVPFVLVRKKFVEFLGAVYRILSLRQNHIVQILHLNLLMAK
jgi:hypothetical protein